MSERLCFCSNDVFMTLISLFPLCTSVKSAEETDLILKCVQVCELGAQCVHSNMLTWELKGSSSAAQLFHSWKSCCSLYWTSCISDWQLMKSVIYDLCCFFFSHQLEVVISVRVRVNIRSVERGPAVSWWSTWTGVWIWTHFSLLTDHKLNSHLWILLKSALYRFVHHELIDAVKLCFLITGVISQTVSLGSYWSELTED